MWTTERFGQYDLYDLNNTLLDQLFLAAGLAVPMKGLRKKVLQRTHGCEISDRFQLPSRQIREPRNLDLKRLNHHYQG